MSAGIAVADHYAVRKIDSIEDMREVFPDGEADRMNWCFLSTSGVHGHGMTLDGRHDPDYLQEIEDEDTPFDVTVLIVQPRLVKLMYGTIEVGNDEDEEFLRGLVRSTLEVVPATQKGNT